jgi:hypothetical protein
MTCEHPELVQVSEATLRWTWTRCNDGTYEPEETHDKVLYEETIDFTCRECGEVVSLDDDRRTEGE